MCTGISTGISYTLISYNSVHKTNHVFSVFMIWCFDENLKKYFQCLQYRRVLGQAGIGPPNEVMRFAFGQSNTALLSRPSTKI